MRHPILIRVAKVSWIALALLVLGVTLNRFDGTPNSDIGVFLVWSLLVLAFPISLAVAFLFSAFLFAAHHWFSITVPTTYVFLVIAWVCFISAGYWQWFVLLPWLSRKWKGRYQGRTSSSV